MKKRMESGMEKEEGFSPYEEFSESYDFLMNDVDYEGWANYILAGIDRNKGPMGIKDVLEMACGTGNMTKALVHQPWRYEAFDFSEGMLSKADEKLLGKGIHFRHLDMRHFSYVKSFDLILCLCDGINYLTQDKDLRQTFQNVRKHLKKGGLFIFDVSTPYKFETELKDQTLVVDEENLTLLWRNEAKEEGHMQMSLTFFEKLKNNHYRRFDEIHHQYTQSKEDYEALLLQAGFDEIQVYSEMSFERAKAQDSRWHFFVK